MLDDLVLSGLTLVPTKLFFRYPMLDNLVLSGLALAPPKLLSDLPC